MADMVTFYGKDFSSRMLIGTALRLRSFQHQHPGLAA